MTLSKGPVRPLRRQVAPNSVLGMLFFVACEIMFFAALVSARFVVKGTTSYWPPPDQPRLPVWTTAFNSVALLISGVLLFRAARAFRRSESHSVTLRLLTGALATGLLFVLLQGSEWVRLISYGLTLRSSVYGSFFYLIIGAHALHAIIALALLAHVWHALNHGRLRAPRFWAAEVFWYFVVGVWPFLYVLVYLF